MACRLSAQCCEGPELAEDARGIAELNGEGEVAGGVVILRSGKNAESDHHREGQTGNAEK